MRPSDDPVVLARLQKGVIAAGQARANDMC
jgi:hypothetical protein